jgi:hypothetical protein
LKPITTCALCSPTRAALITGRNHHPVPSGVIGEIATGYDGYTSVIPHSAGTVAGGRMEQAVPAQFSLGGGFDVGRD